MQTKLKVFTVATILLVGTSSAVMAQFTCPPGHRYYEVCPWVSAPGYSNAVSDEAAEGASGNGTGGAVDALVGGVFGTAEDVLTGTANKLAVAPHCAPGYTYHNEACYLPR